MYRQSVGRRLLNGWYRFAAPAPPDVLRAPIDVRDRYRRGRLVSIVILIVCAAAALAFLSSLPELLGNLSNSGGALIAFANTGGALSILFISLALARLNRAGHVNAAGLTSSLLIMLMIAGVLASEDFAVGGYSWVDTASWDLMVAGLLVAALSLPPRLAGLMLGVYLGLLGVLVLVIPQSPGVLQQEYADGLLTPQMPLSTQHLVLTADLLYRPLTLSIIATLLGIATNRGVLQTLRNLGAQEELANERQRIIEQREQLLEQQLIQEHWITHAVAALNTALAQHTRFVPPDLPASWRDNSNLVALHGLLVNAGRRLESGQFAEHAIALLHAHIQQLPAQIQQRRAAGIRGGQSGPLQDLDMEYMAVADIRPTGYAPMDTLLADLRHYLGQMGQEELATSQEILRAIGEFINRGDLTRRISEKLLPLRFGQVVFALNWLFEQMQSRLSGRSPAPDPPQYGQ